MEDFYAHIDDYMQGLLKGEALEAFERKMAEDDSLRLAVENYDVAKGISEALLEVDMMETLSGLKEAERTTDLGDDAEVKEMEDKTVSGRGARKFNLRRWVAAASFIGVLVIAGWWVLDLKAEREFVLANYEKPYDDEATKSVELDTMGMSDFQIGKMYFNRNRFEESIPYFEKYVLGIKDKKLLSEGYYWLGSAYIEVWRVEDAREAWEKSDDERAKRSLEVLKK